VRYREHWFDPERWLTFIEAKGFSDDWNDLGLEDDELRTLQIGVMLSPKKAPVVQGTGGLRKLRFAPMRWRRGKRSAARVLYVYYEEFGIVLLVAAYGKSERDDMPKAYRKAYRELIEQQRKVLASGAKK
jgi:hypothetical protein